MCVTAAGKRALHDVQVARRQDRGLQRRSTRRSKPNGSRSILDDRVLLRRSPDVCADIILDGHMDAGRARRRSVRSTSLTVFFHLKNS